MIKSIENIITEIGDDINREGLKETPERVVKSFEALYEGYTEDPKKHLKTFEDDSSDEMVILKNIEFYSTCEHHMLPFFGVAHIAYIPNNCVIGVSKLARILNCYTRRLQIQERICKQITSLIDENLKPKGSACILEAQHFCMTSRGVQKQKAKMITSSLTGCFKCSEVRQEFLQLVRD